MAVLSTNIVTAASPTLDETVAMAAAASGGDTYANSEREWVRVENSTGSAITLYFAFYVDGQTIVQGKSFTIPANKAVLIPPRSGVYTDPATGRASMTYSTHTGLKLGVFRYS
jgi:hypothetical protein